MTIASEVVFQTSRPLVWPNAVFGFKGPNFTLTGSPSTFSVGVDMTGFLEQGWQADFQVLSGYAVRPPTENGFEYVCTQAGQTGARQPLWPASPNVQVVDGSVVWTSRAASTASLGTTVASVSLGVPGAGRRIWGDGERAGRISDAQRFIRAAGLELHRLREHHHGRRQSEDRPDHTAGPLTWP